MAASQSDIFKSYTHPRYHKFKTITVPKIETFVDKQLKITTTSSKAIFYPFGGPDLIYPLTLFPQAHSYLLVGLEPVGVLDESLQIPSNLDAQLDSLLRRSFFVTASMRQFISSKQGVLPMFLAQIALQGGVVKDIQIINHPFGKLLEISFTHLQLDKKLLYVQTNVVDQSLNEDFTKFIENNELFDACIIKASSYALHQKSFSKLRNFILAKANIILQDDSGISLRELSQDFEIHLFGDYTKPYGVEWAGYFQQDLRKMYDDTQSRPKIPFCYGYGCGKVQTGLLLATRKLHVD